MNRAGKDVLTHLIYIDKELGGLQNMKSDKNPPQYAALTEKEMDFIDLGETLPYDKKGLSKDAKKILKKKPHFCSLRGSVNWNRLAMV